MDPTCRRASIGPENFAPVQGHCTELPPIQAAKTTPVVSRTAAVLVFGLIAPITLTVWA